MMKFLSTALCPHLFNYSTAVPDGHFSVLNMYFYEKYGNMTLDWLFNYKLIKKTVIRINKRGNVHLLSYPNSLISSPQHFYGNFVTKKIRT